MLVKDYKGELIPKEEARKIKGEDGTFQYYQIGVSCIKMPDDKWYRTTTGKIIYDYTLKDWVHAKDFKGVKGLVEDGSIGFFSDLTELITVNFKKDSFVRRKVFDPTNKNLADLPVMDKKWVKVNCISEEVAAKNGYIESIYDGNFYKEEDCTKEDLVLMKTCNIPQAERNNTYSLDDDKAYRERLEDAYDGNELKVEKELEILARKYLPFTFGLELEVQNGHIPARVREPLGFRNCRDGSLGTGIELVSIPMEGGKGLQAVKKICQQATLRAQISNKCSVHIHYGDVRRDKIYVISLWQLLFKIQEEFRLYFPFSRTNTIREDGKVYAAMLPDLGLKTSTFMKKKEEDFKVNVNETFKQIYTFLNAGHPPGEIWAEEYVKDTREVTIKGKPQKQYCYRVKRFNYTTKLPRHAIQGHKWQRPQRYYFCNFLNLFFAHSKTIEMRISEATTNFDKVLILMLTYTAILKYAENFSKCLSNEKVTLKDILDNHFEDNKELSTQIMNYWEERKSRFCTGKNFNANWKDIEAIYMGQDKTFVSKLKW